MIYRHEVKHVINTADMYILRQRLKAVMQPDPHAENGVYRIRSLYFDNASDKALREKTDGVNEREKFRIRLYNGDTSFICLEKKSKKNDLCAKTGAVITAEETEKIISGELSWMADDDRRLVSELYIKMKTEGLRPKTIVDYTREPFVFAPGNVRVTLDCNIRTGLTCTDILSPDVLTAPAGDPAIVLEVKWDGFLPDIIRDAVQLDSRRSSAFSKYERCRVYG